MISDNGVEPDGQSAVGQRRMAWQVGVFKCVFLLSMLRMFAAPATKDFFDRYVVSWPTWEWPLYALVPIALIYLYRRPGDWDALRGERSLIKWALLLYLFYALLFAVGAGVWILWAAVVICVSGLIGIWYLNRKERLRAA
ncbi:hypothetical protein [Streptomyces venezuelae]|uniref:hypothetical protein n=1 Tax=Streptomyces venezuelae TaxID=54571 RepID=UPI0037B09161